MNDRYIAFPRTAGPIRWGVKDETTGVTIIRGIDEFSMSQENAEDIAFSLNKAREERLSKIKETGTQ